MKEIQGFLQQFDWNVLTPIITFALGLSYSFFDKYLERRRKVKNLKKILLWELCENQGLMTVMSEHTKPTQEDIDSIIHLSEYLSFSVYETYLNRIDSLNEEEIESLSQTYFYTRCIKKDCKEFKEKRSIKEISDGISQDRLLVMNEILMKTINTAMQNTFYSMIFMGGNKADFDAESIDVKKIIDFMRPIIHN